jgi:hypothetical protein
MLIAKRGGDPMVAHIAMMKALYRNKPKEKSNPQLKGATVYKIVR